jgi:hypothetical protein
MWGQGELTIHTLPNPSRLSYTRSSSPVLDIGGLVGGLDRSVSVELGLVVNRSTNENTFAWRVPAVVDETCAFSLSRDSWRTKMP